MKINNTLVLAGILAASFAIPTTSFAMAHQGQDMKPDAMKMQMMMLGKSGLFMGVEAKAGFVNVSQVGKQFHLKVSDDFTIPASPAPSWQVIDKDGNTYLLNQFKIAGDKFNREITLPKYIHSVAKVQVWCSFAEVVLGEASFTKTLSLK